MNFGIVTTNGYLTVSTDESVSNEDVWQMIQNGKPLYGTYTMPGAPAHAPGDVLLNPASVVAVVQR